jgi:hypothetical protein
MAFHPQMIADFGAIEEISTRFFDELGEPPTPPE